MTSDSPIDVHAGRLPARPRTFGQSAACGAKGLPRSSVSRRGLTASRRTRRRAPAAARSASAACSGRARAGTVARVEVAVARKAGQPLPLPEPPRQARQGALVRPDRLGARAARPPARRQGAVDAAARARSCRAAPTSCASARSTAPARSSASRASRRARRSASAEPRRDCSLSRRMAVPPRPDPHDRRRAAATSSPSRRSSPSPRSARTAGRTWCRSGTCADGDELRGWTYAKSQKAKNLERDPHATLQIEDGVDYQELRGVMFECDVEVERDPEQGRRLRHGAVRALRARRRRRGPGRGRARWSGKQAQKRIGLRFVPTRTVSWDHRKLGGTY